MIGITCSFHDVNNYINLPIKYIQILFMTREDGPIMVPITEIIQLKNKLTKRNIIPYVYIDLNIAIYYSYRIRTQNRLKWLFKYAEALEAKACIIHSRFKWNTPRIKVWIRNRSTCNNFKYTKMGRNE